jgi:hypothetical protein
MWMAVLWDAAPCSLYTERQFTALMTEAVTCLLFKLDLGLENCHLTEQLQLPHKSAKFHYCRGHNILCMQT